MPAGEGNDLEHDLFGSDDDDDEEEELQQPAVKEDRRSKLQELADRKAAEKREAEAKSGKGARSHRDAEEGEGNEAGAAPAAAYDSEDDDEGDRTAADDAFIDDAGADPAAQLFGEESEGEDEFEKMQRKGKEARKRAKGDGDPDSVAREVELFLGRMEVAVENDIKANEARKPAIHKLKLAKEMSEKLSQAHLQGAFIDAGGLTVLTHWLSPLPDGSLPNINIRSAILRLLLLMPIHVHDPERREQLKKSGLGKVVMFLYKLPEETNQNRRYAKDLVERWSRPIFALENKHQHGREEERRRLNPNEVASQRKRKAAQDPDVELDEDGNPVIKKGPAPGERGWRWHASIPQSSKLDYSVRPESQFSSEEMARKKESKAKHDKLEKKLKNMKAVNKRRVGSDRPNKMSIEGRGILQ